MRTFQTLAYQKVASRSRLIITTFFNQIKETVVHSRSKCGFTRDRSKDDTVIITRDI